MIENPSWELQPDDIPQFSIEGQLAYYKERSAYNDGRAAGEAAASLIMTSEVTIQQVYTAEANRYDPMTGALKESELIREIALDQKQNPNAPRGIIVIDIGNLKKANRETQDPGDNVLRRSRLFRRSTDHMGRAGDRADEFIVYADLTSKEGLAPQEVLKRQIQRIRRSRKELIAGYPFLDEGSVRLFVGAGGTLYDNSKTYAQNRQLANIEMTIAKKRGRRAYGSYRVEEVA